MKLHPQGDTKASRTFYFKNIVWERCKEFILGIHFTLFYNRDDNERSCAPYRWYNNLSLQTAHFILRIQYKTMKKGFLAQRPKPEEAP